MTSTTNENNSTTGDERIIKWFKARPWSYIILSVAGICFVTFFSGRKAGKYFEQESIVAFAPLDSIYAKNCKILKETAPFADSVSTMLLQKTEIIEDRKTHHKYLFLQMYRFHYTAVTIFPYLTGLLVILSFFVTQKGWKDCNDWIKAVFMTVAFLTALYGLIPTIYKQTETINQNLDCYLKLDKLQKEIFDYSLTAPALYQDSSLTLKKFINDFNTKEKELIKISFGLEQQGLGKDILSNIGN